MEWEEDKDVTALLGTICHRRYFDVAQAMAAMEWSYFKSFSVMLKAVELGQASKLASESNFAIKFL